MKFLKRFLAGIGMGIAASIAGVSGGTVAVILKVYDELVWSISNIFKQFKKSILIILPILLGAVVALIPCFLLLSKALEGMVFATVCLFAGLVIGSFPSVTEEVKGVKLNKRYIIAIVVAALIAILLGVLSVVFGDKVNISEAFKDPKAWLYVVMIPVGALAAIALVIPGISGSMILLIIGFYKPIVDLISNWIQGIRVPTTGQVFGLLGCFIIGAILGIFFISKLMNYLLLKHHNTTYMAIIGFIIGSTITLFFNHDIFAYYQKWATGGSTYLPIYGEIPLGIGLLILGIIGAYFLIKLSRKRKLENENKDEKSEK